MNYIKNTYDLSSIEAPFKNVTYSTESNIKEIEIKLSSTTEQVPTPTPTPTPSAVAKKEKFIESKMTLIQIQELAKVRGLDITKEGKQGKQIAKTKKELCDEMNAME
jgi:hypothetical protein